MRNIYIYIIYILQYIFVCCFRINKSYQRKLTLLFEFSVFFYFTFYYYFFYREELRSKLNCQLSFHFILILGVFSSIKVVAGMGIFVVVKYVKSNIHVTDHSSLSIFYFILFFAHFIESVVCV